MRLVKVAFNGYKSLKETGCNLDGKLIAVLGPNEAGKSSVLNALQWLNDGGRLPGHARTRNAGVTDDTEVVRATYTLSEEDRAAVAEYSPTVPNTFAIARTAAGHLRKEMVPRPVTDHHHIDQALADMAELDRLVRLAFQDDTPDDVRGIESQLAGLRTALAEPDVPRSRAVARELIASVSLRLADLDLAAEDFGDDDAPMSRHGQFHQVQRRLLSRLDRVAEVLKGDRPEAVVANILWKRTPDFVLFTDDDRSLHSTYELADEALRANPPKALSNLLMLAGVDVKVLYEVIQSNDRTKLRTMLRQANGQLAESLRPNWRQADLSLAINTDATTLEVLIEEHHTGAVTAIHERSDGLRAFFALVCFLAVRPTSFPPILLIDEAELHLHLDAQADLVAVLARQELAQQVIYTTHSPGCLPADLGTGVRFVQPEPAKAGVSSLRNDFWQTRVPGFSPLLFAMGAGAAAFSVCRRAVLCEGPSEMILLPTLLRAATGLPELSYQVAPGLSVTSVSDLSVNVVAARVAYLTDGDAGGLMLRKQLRAGGIAPERILSLPEGSAIEDLVTRQLVVETTSELLADAGHAGPWPGVADVSGAGTIGKSLTVWCKDHGVRMPSKTAVAAHLLPKIDARSLTPDGRSALLDLHASIVRVLE